MRNILALSLTLISSPKSRFCVGELVASYNAHDLALSHRRLAQCNQEFCGGFAAFPCDCECQEQDLVPQCVDDPMDYCDPLDGGSDCAGICVCRGKDGTLPVCSNQACGGTPGLFCDCDCPNGAEVAVCLDDPTDNCELSMDCIGVCTCVDNTPPNQPMMQQCPSGAMCIVGTSNACLCTCSKSGETATCVDDSSDNCNPLQGGTNCPGTCICGNVPSASPGTTPGNAVGSTLASAATRSTTKLASVVVALAMLRNLF